MRESDSTAIPGLNQCLRRKKSASAAKHISVTAGSLMVSVLTPNSKNSAAWNACSGRLTMDQLPSMSKLVRATMLISDWLMPPGAYNNATLMTAENISIKAL